MNIIIMGGGRVGTHFLRVLVGNVVDGPSDISQHNVCLVERQRTRIEALPPRLLEHPAVSVVEGDGASSEVLVVAGAEEADAFVALTGDDRVNALAAQKAKHFFKIEHVALRVRDPELARMYTDLGLAVFCPTEAAREFFMAHIFESVAE